MQDPTPSRELDERRAGLWASAVIAVLVIGVAAGVLVLA
jgi:hypothetical protein